MAILSFFFSGFIVFLEIALGPEEPVIPFIKDTSHGGKQSSNKGLPTLTFSFQYRRGTVPNITFFFAFKFLFDRCVKSFHASLGQRAIGFWWVTYDQFFDASSSWMWLVLWQESIFQMVQTPNKRQVELRFILCALYQDFFGGWFILFGMIRIMAHTLNGQIKKVWIAPFSIFFFPRWNSPLVNLRWFPMICPRPWC